VRNPEGAAQPGEASPVQVATPTQVVEGQAKSMGGLAGTKVALLAAGPEPPAGAFETAL
jgi:hypothetical protein